MAKRPNGKTLIFRGVGDVELPYTNSEERKVITEQYRDLYATDYDGDRCTAATDEQMWAVLETVKGDDKNEDVLNERVQALHDAEYKTLDTVGQPSSTPLVDESSAYLAKLSTAAANRLNDDTFVNTCIIPLEEAGDTLKRGTLDVLFWLLKLNNYKQERDAEGKVISEGPVEPVDFGKLETCALARKVISYWPLPGNAPQGSNELYEKYSVVVHKDDGTRINATKWFYKETFIKTKHGREVAKMVDDLAEKGGEASVRQAVKIAPPKSERARYASYITNIVGKMKRCKAVVDIWNGIDDKTGGKHLSVHFVRAIENGKAIDKPATTDLNIYVEDHGGNRSYYKETDFRRLRPKLMTQFSLEGLAATIPPRKKRGARAGAGAGTAEGQNIPLPTVSQAESQLAGIAQQIVDNDDWKALFQKRIGENSDFNLSMYEFYIELSLYYNPKGGIYRKQAEALFDQRAAQQQKEKEEKAAALKLKEGDKAAA